MTAEGYWEARRALGAAAVPMVEAVRARSLDEALAAAAELGYPVALKAAGLLHKSDAGGVVLGIGDDESLATAVEDIRERLGQTDLALERMVPLADGVELIVGCRWDARFGPLLTLGIGGLYAELLTDTQTALAPVDEQDAARLLHGLRGAPMLRGARGRPSLDVDAAARAAVALSRFAAAHPEVAAVEVNPLLVLPQGVVGLDARLVLSEEGPA